MTSWKKKQEREKELQLEAYEAEFKNLTNAANELNAPADKFKEKTLETKTKVSRMLGEIKEAYDKIARSVNDKRLIEQSLVGKFMLNQFIDAPISNDNKDLMKESIFDYGKTLSYENKQSLESENKLLRREETISKLHLEHKKSEIDKIKSSTLAYQKIAEFYKSVVSQNMYRFHKSYKVCLCYLWKLEQHSTIDVEIVIQKEGCGYFKPAVLQIDADQILFFKNLNSRKTLERIKLKTAKEAIVINACKYFKFTYNNHESQDFSVVLHVPNTEQFESLKYLKSIVEQNLKALYSSVVLVSAPLMQDNASKVGQELLSLPPLDNYIDYQKFKNKEIQGQDALGENTNYLSLLILLKKYEDSFLTEMAHMKHTQAERTVLMKGSQGLPQFSNTIGEYDS